MTKKCESVEWAGRRWQWCVVAVASVWCLLQIVLPGRFPSTDGAFFKEAGWNLATNAQLAAPAFEGFWGLSPDISEVFGVYQPVYPVGFAQILRFVTDIRQADLLFDSIIHLALVLAVVFFLPAVIPCVGRSAAATTGLLCNFLGTYGRPDELGIAFALVGLGLFYSRPKRWRPAVLTGAGVSIGLCCATSLPVTAIFGVWALIPWFWRLWDDVEHRRRLILDSVVVGVVALFVCLLVVVPAYARPGALKQFFGHAASFPLSALRRALEGRDPRFFLRVWITGWRGNLFQVSLAVSLYVLLLGALSCRLVPRGLPRAHVSASLVVMSLIAVVLPQEGYYYWFVLPCVIGLLVGTFIRRPLMLALVIGACLLVGGQSVRELGKHMLLPDEQHEAFIKRMIRDRIPPDSTLLVDPDTYFLVRNDYSRVHVGWLGCWGVLHKVDYCLLGSRWLHRDKNGYAPNSGMITLENLALLQSEFSMVYDWLPTKRVQILGIPLSRSPAGYGVAVLRRKGLGAEGLRD